MRGGQYVSCILVCLICQDPSFAHNIPLRADIRMKGKYSKFTAAILRWKLVGGSSIRKEFDLFLKGYVFSLAGSSATTAMQLPKVDKIGCESPPHVKFCVCLTSL